MDYHWERQPKAEALLLKILGECEQANPNITELSDELTKHTSTRLFDWVDHLAVVHSHSVIKELEEVGFESEHATSSYRVFHHPGAQLPRVVVVDANRGGVAVKVDSCADFLQARGICREIEGTFRGEYRRACVETEKEISLWVVERRCGHTMEPVTHNTGYVEKYLKALELWQTRPRDLEGEAQAMQKTLDLAEELVEILGEDLTAWAVFEAERKYWESRNLAAQIQKNRQDRLGMGWANHDHHTFRSSRKLFPQLVRLFEILGFHCRERFYAGEEAGWGAQVMENPRCGLVLFLDLDLAPKEVKIDFAHHELPELPEYGTVGLWCALHGDSALKAGMHHLEAQFSFEELTGGLEKHGISMMEPFSNFPYLKQAFTHGEIWKVDSCRVKDLLSKRKIEEKDAEKFLKYGAVGSHLENLQRREGYKGFNQENVSFIIKKTDPRSLNLT